MSMTLRDPNQIVSEEHDELNNAKRVIIVGGEMPEFKVGQVSTGGFTPPEVIKIEVPVIVKELEIKEIEKQIPIISTELKIEKIEVPVLVKEIHVEKIEVPIIIKEYEKITLPAEVKEIISKEVMPKWAMVLIIIQSILTTLAILF